MGRLIRNGLRGPKHCLDKANLQGKKNDLE